MTAVLEADTTSPDGVNEVYFGNIDDPGVIGVTIVWGIFGGAPHGRELVEWDQVYDEVDYAWSASGETEKMDFENVATHELGHSMGLTHPDDSCDLETMYRYTDYGETMRRDLHDGDIAGIDSLY
ncbi:matrixin family metalloprotease [Patescibacteria group bacterium]